MECARTPTHKRTNTCVCTNNLSQVATAKKTHTHTQAPSSSQAGYFGCPAQVNLCAHWGIVWTKKNGTTLALDVRTVLESLQATAMGLYAYYVKEVIFTAVTGEAVGV